MSINNERDEKDYTGCIIFIAIIVCLVLWIGGIRGHRTNRLNFEH